MIYKFTLGAPPGAASGAVLGARADTILPCVSRGPTVASQIVVGDRLALDPFSSVLVENIETVADPDYVPNPPLDPNRPVDADPAAH